MICLLMLIALSIQGQKTHVLIAGVSNYGVDSINLANTTKDVKDLKKVMVNQKYNVKTLTSKYANHRNIASKLDSIAKVAKTNDKIIFYFSGHGSIGGFVPSDRSLFNYQELVDILSKTKAKHVICIIDACMSGSVKSISKNNFGLGDSYPKICFMTASDATEISKESSIVGHGFFTKALLKGLRANADHKGNQDKKVTLKELFTYVYNDVVYRTRNSDIVQHPQLVPTSMGTIIMARW